MKLNYIAIILLIIAGSLSCGFWALNKTKKANGHEQLAANVTTGLVANSNINAGVEESEKNKDKDNSKLVKKYDEAIANKDLSQLTDIELKQVKFGVDENKAVIDPWFNGYSYREPITISYSGTALTNFQVLVTTNTQTLVGASKMQADCGDIRMTSSDGYTAIDYWIESGCNTASTRIWVEVPSIPDGGTTIYMYYGNSSAANGTNGTNTFLFFDNFAGASIDTNKWTVDAVNNITETVSNYFRFEDATKSGSTYWIYNNTDSGSQHQAKWTPTSSFVVDWRSTLSDTSSTQMGSGSVALVGSDNLLSAFITHTDDQGASIAPRVSYMFVEATTATGIVVSDGDVRDFRYVVNGTSVKVYEKASSSGTYNLKVDGTSSSINKLSLAAGAYGGYSFLNHIQIDNLFVRNFAATEPTTSVGSEVQLITQAGTGATDWTWKAPVINDKIRSGSATDWTWTTWTDNGAGVTVPYSTATSWTWYP